MLVMWHAKVSLGSFVLAEGILYHTRYSSLETFVLHFTNPPKPQSYYQVIDQVTIHGGIVIIFLEV